MLKVTYKNALGESIEMGAEFPYILGRNSGFSSNDVITQMSKGYNQNGMYYYGSLDGPRIINITAYYKYADDYEGKQRQKDIARVFNPRLGMGQLIYEDSAGRYTIDAAVSLKPVIYRTTEKEYAMMRAFDVVLTCPKPDWLSYESYQIKMVDFLGGLTLPFSLPFTLADRGDGGRVDYEGDNPASVVLDFRVAEGGTSVINPRIENQQGEYIKIEKTITEGQKMLIDTNPDAPSVTFADEYGNESDAWDSLVFGSKFFQLNRGLNVFSFTADSGSPELYMTYKNHYAGV